MKITPFGVILLYSVRIIKDKLVIKKTWLSPFILPQDMRDQIEVTAAPAMIKHFTDRINSMVDKSTKQENRPLALGPLALALLRGLFRTRTICAGRWQMAWTRLEREPRQ